MSDAEMIEIKPLDKWDGSAIKNRLDDAVKFFFTHTNQYKENFILIDIRLGISLMAVGVAVFALIWDYMNPFPTSRPILLICVCAYFVFMAILTIYTTMIEKGIFLKAKHGNKVNKFDYKILCLSLIFVILSYIVNYRIIIYETF